MPTAIIIHKDSGIKEFGVSLSLFRHMAFRKVTFQQKQFGTIDILARVPLFPRTFRLMDILSLWTFQHRDILAPWTGIHYGTGTFRHRGQNVLVLKQPYCCAWSQNILVPKWPSAVMSLCQNLNDTDSTVSKYSHAEMSQCLNVPMAEHPQHQNIQMPKRPWGIKYWMCFIPRSIIIPPPLIRACFVSIFANNQLRKLTAKGY